jgi:hypothetical protein
MTAASRHRFVVVCAQPFGKCTEVPTSSPGASAAEDLVERPALVQISLRAQPFRVDNTPVGAFLCCAATTGVIGQDEL